MGDLNGANGDLRARVGLVAGAPVLMLRESLGFIDREASILVVG